jgi:hypothetical protein
MRAGSDSMWLYGADEAELLKELFAKAPHAGLIAKSSRAPSLRVVMKSLTVRSILNLDAGGS